MTKATHTQISEILDDNPWVPVHVSKSSEHDAFDGDIIDTTIIEGVVHYDVESHDKSIFEIVALENITLAD